MFHNLKIEKIIAGGKGLGRLPDGMVVLTRHVLPGENIRVRETNRRKGFMEAETVEIIDAAPQRISPPCPYFPLCGGCDFQHIDTAYQQQIKWEILRESLSRTSVCFDDTIMQPLLPSPNSLHYRHRIRLKVGNSGQPGFYEAGSNKLVPVRSCLLATDLLNQALGELIDSELLKKSAGHCKEIELQHSPADNRIIAILHLRRGTYPPKQITSLTAPLNTINNWLIKTDKKLISLESQPSTAVLCQDINDMNDGLSCRLAWSPGCFFQVNAVQCLNLISLVLNMYRKSGGKNVLELYCGMGTFSIPLALSGANLTAIEQNPESIRWAELNAQRSGLDQCVFTAGGVAPALKNFARQKSIFDTVLLDPPRQGIGKPTDDLIRLAPGNIIYISCDTATLARDLARLTEGGYRLIRITPVDMFPQTHHIETVALLEKN